MARKTRPITFDTVREIGRTLPGVEEGTAYGSPALKIHGRMFTCIPVHQSAEPDSLAVVCGGGAERDEMIGADPDTYYVTEHYVDYRIVLVRLAHVHRDALRDLLATAYRHAAAKGPRRTSRQPTRARRR